MIENKGVPPLSPRFQNSKTLISNSDHPRGIKVDDMRVFLRSVCCR